MSKKEKLTKEAIFGIKIAIISIALSLFLSSISFFLEIVSPEQKIAVTWFVALATFIIGAFLFYQAIKIKV